jgi:hypothetical protein
MRALPDTQDSDFAGSAFGLFLLRHRIWVYLVLFLIAVSLIFVDYRAPGAQNPPPSSVGATQND